MIRTILFDLDGTLIDTWRLYLECYRRALGEFFSTPPTDSEIAEMQPASEIRLFRHIAGEKRYPDCLERFYSGYESLHDELFDGAYPGVTDMLEKLRATGCKTGIVTGKSRRAWDITAGRCGLGEFDVVITDDDVRELKPHPEGIRLALGALGGSAESSLYIGDSCNDGKAASAAGMVFGAVLWSKNGDEIGDFISRVRRYGETRALSTPSGVIELIGKGPETGPISSL